MDEFIALHHRMNEIVTNMPGFVSVNLLGQRMERLWRWRSLSHWKPSTWRDHPEHVVARQRGLEFFGDYSGRFIA
jgi:heme-degrading monooxygenase HmoA